MPHYKDTDNKLHWLDDSSFAHYLPQGCVEITDEEAKSLRPIPPEPSYAYKRAAEYPPIVDQLDLIYHSGIDAWKSAIQTIKDKYPKS